MTKPLRRAFAATLLGLSLVAVAPAAQARDNEAASRAHRERCLATGAQAFTRTELFFGLSRPGGIVTEEEFKIFVDQRVTPRFPDGLTLLSGTGQFRDAGGTILVEGSKLLILLYPLRDRDAANGAVEQIREQYKAQFQQQSVLRVDEVSCVSF